MEGGERMRRVVFCVTVLMALSLAGSAGTREASAETLANEELKPIEINGSTWEIDLRPAGQKGKGPVEKDTLVFSKGKFTSKNLEAQRYSAVDYSLRLGNDGSTIWETMQTKEGKGLVFLAREYRP